MVDSQYKRLLPGKETQEVMQVLEQNGSLSMLQTEALQRLKDDVRMM